MMTFSREWQAKLKLVSRLFFLTDYKYLSFCGQVFIERAVNQIQRFFCNSSTSPLSVGHKINLSDPILYRCEIRTNCQELTMCGQLEGFCNCYNKLEPCKFSK